MGAHERPLSPHLQVYRWQITNTLSILHRATGLVLSLGLLILVCWLVSVASGPAAFESIAAFYSGPVFDIVLTGWSFCFFYHLANGVRHLFWDSGRGFGHAQIAAGGWAVVIFSIAATVVFAASVVL